MKICTNFPDRAERLSRFFNDVAVAQDFPLLKSTQLPIALLNNLTTAVRLFLVDTLQSFYSQPFDSDVNLLVEYRDALLGLPNITPNGLFLPKDATNLSFNAVHLATVAIMESLKFNDVIEQLQLPVGLRLVRGELDLETAKRPYATTKVHLDIWAGEPTYAYMAFIPLLGEVEKNGVGFYEPTSVPEKFLKPLEDYLGGQALLQGAVPYPARFKRGELIVVDPFLLHHTLKQSPGLRLSLEFRILPKERVTSDILSSGTTFENYRPYALWRKIGREKLYLSHSPLKTNVVSGFPPPFPPAINHHILDVSTS